MMTFSVFSDLHPPASTPSLRFLALQGNRLTVLDGVETLASLMFLDVSDNPPLRRLDELVASLPASLRFVACGGCGAARDEEYRAALVATLPALRTLDAVDVTRGERRAAREAFGEDPDDTDEEEEGEGGEEGDEAVAREEEEGGDGDAENGGAMEGDASASVGPGGVPRSRLEDVATRGIAQLNIEDGEGARLPGEAGEAGAAAAAAISLAAGNKARAAAAATTAAATAATTGRTRPPSASASSSAVETERRRLHSIIPTLTDPTMDSAVGGDSPLTPHPEMHHLHLEAPPGVTRWPRRRTAQNK